MKVKYSIGIVIVFILLSLSLALSGCGSDSGSSTSSTETSDSDTTLDEIVLVQSGLDRNTFPEVSEEDISTLVEGNNAFALDLYHFLEQEKKDENRFFSPYSISLGFAIVYGGARNNTEAQMEEVFHYTLGQDSLHPAFNALDLDLASREQNFDDDGEEDFKLNIANSMWGQRDYEFLVDYLDLLAENYGAGIRLLDLQN